MIEIKYIDGTSETFEIREENNTIKFYHSYFRYDSENQMFIVFTNDNENNCMRIPRESLKSIMVIEV